MEYHTRFEILPRVEGRTPVHSGVNVESQEHHDRSNLWDWLADSGFTVARQFHPDTDLRRRAATEADWAGIRTAADYAALRAAARRAPREAIRWDLYRFDTTIPWLGQPDGLVSTLRAAGLENLISVGYHPRMYPRPLWAGDAGEAHPETRPEIWHWPAVASAYDAYFAHFHRFGVEQDARWFMMLNEPENQTACWHLPSDLVAALADAGADLWMRLYRDDDQPTGLGRRFLDAVAGQYAILCRIAREALEDVRAIQRAAGRADDLKLLGPANVVWAPLWDRAAPYLDALDFHHYNPAPKAIRDVYAAVADRARRAGKSTACTEFNLRSGGLPIERLPFGMTTAMDTARLFMSALSMAAPDGPALEWLVFYVFHFPSTHRNYKHLVYGDMNTLDWSGRDRPLRGRGAACHPSFEEQQIRFATPGYAMLRMLNRCVCYRDAGAGPHAVQAVGRLNPTSAGPDDVHYHVETLAVRQPGRLLVNLLNPTERAARGCVVDPRPLGGDWRHALVRRTTRSERDLLVAALDAGAGSVTLDLPGQSLTQLIFTNEPIEAVETLTLTETTVTPGRVLSGPDGEAAPGLARWQTTRLRAIGWCGAVAPDLTDPLDLTDLAVVWESDEPEIVRVDQGGLTQRLRDAAQPVTLTARTLDGRLAARVTVPGGSAAS